MASTSMSLGKHWEDFLKKCVTSGKYGSATEVVRAALRDMEVRDQAKENLRRLIQEGEDSGYIEWDPENFKRRIYLKYAEAAEQDAQAFDHED